MVMRNSAEAARNLGISPGLLGKWVREAEKSDGLAFRGNGKLTPEQLEIRQLKEENRKLKMERKILKKTAVESTLD